MVVAAGYQHRPAVADRPSGQRAGTRAHVVLGVTVVVAEGEQLHEFAGQVLIGGPGGVELSV